MPTSTRNQDDDTEKFDPTPNQMFEREGLDRKALRRELAATTPIDLETLYIEREDRDFIDPRTMQMPYGPSGLGETGGHGVEELRIQGETWKTFRYVNGFEMLAEEGVNDAATQRDYILEMFDFLADANFFKGIQDYNSGSTLRTGVFDWLTSNIPSDRTFDCENHDGDTDDANDFTGVEENLLQEVVYENLDYTVFDAGAPRFDLMVGRIDALSAFNLASGSDGGEVGDTYWQRISADDAIVSVADRMVVPDELQFDTMPQGENINEDPPKVDLTTELGTDEVILLPDMDVVEDSYWRLSEMPEPEVFGPYDERGGREAVDYAWRYSHQFDPDNRYENVDDAVHLKNVSALFN